MPGKSGKGSKRNQAQQPHINKYASERGVLKPKSQRKGPENPGPAHATTKLGGQERDRSTERLPFSHSAESQRRPQQDGILRTMDGREIPTRPRPLDPLPTRKAEPPPPPPTPVVKRAELARAQYSDQMCPYCSTFPNTARESIDTDQGKVEVVVCFKCLKKFLPFVRSWQ